MRKKRLIWTIGMLAVMILSLVTMFFPWNESSGGAEAALPGNILRWVLVVIVALVFAVVVFLYFTRRTAWGMVYALVQGGNLFAVRAVTSAANKEAGTQLYSMTPWYAACVFFTAAIILVWVVGFFMGAWKRPSVKHLEDPGTSHKLPLGKKASRREKAAEKEADEDYDEALAIAEQAELMRAKAEAARKAAEAADAEEAGKATSAEGAKSWSAEEAAAIFMGDLPQEEAGAPRKKVPAQASRDGLGGDEIRKTAPTAPENENIADPDTAEFFLPPASDAGVKESPAKAPENLNLFAPDADPYLADGDEDEDNDYLDASYSSVDGKGEAADAGSSDEVFPEDEPLDDEEEDAADEEESKEGNEDFMDALGGFLGGLFAVTKKGASKAAGGIRAKAANARARRKSEDELAAEAELAEEDAAEEAAGAEEFGTEASSEDHSPEAVARAIMPDGDGDATLRGSGTDFSEEEGGKKGFRIFGRKRRDRKEEPGSLRDQEEKDRKKAEKSGKWRRFFIKAGIGLVVILLIVLGVFLLVRKITLEKINMEDYVVISSSGYEGYGVAEVTVDREALEEDVANALVKKGLIRTGSGTAVEAFKAFENYNVIMEQLGFTVDKDDHLSNGDVVTVSFVCDNEILKEYGLKAGPEQMTHTVRGLKVVRNYSPFDSDLIVEFTGTEPYGRIILTWAGSYPLHFTKSQSDGLSNGDVVVVTAIPNEGFTEETLAVEYGIILSETSREYPVTGLSNYISNVSSLTGTVLSGLDEEAKAIIQEKVAGDYGKNETLAACEREGTLILTGSEETDARNYVYMVYKLTYERGKTLFDYYYYVRFRNVILHTDGSYVKDETCEVPTGRHGLFGLLDNDDALRIDWLHAVVGFETIEDLYTKKIADKVGAFTVSTDLAIEGIPADALTPTGTPAAEPVISPEASAPEEGDTGDGSSEADVSADSAENTGDSSAENAGENSVENADDNSADVPL